MEKFEEYLINKILFPKKNGLTVTWDNLTYIRSEFNKLYSLPPKPTIKELRKRINNGDFRSNAFQTCS